MEHHHGREGERGGGHFIQRTLPPSFSLLSAFIAGLYVSTRALFYPASYVCRYPQMDVLSVGACLKRSNRTAYIYQALNPACQEGRRVAKYVVVAVQ